MTRIARAWSGLALAAALLSACASADKPVVAPPSPAPVAAPGQRVVTVSEANDGAAVALEATQQLVVRLPAEAAGRFEWAIVDPTPGVLKVLGSTFERAPRSATIDESAGTMVWQLRPEAAGAVRLSFELRRPRTLLPPTRTVSYDVTVR